ncbi:MAG: MFS transporter [Deltaproteobacteria bacterium]|nr:MFS transporter [Deltaproteobacteria bacterium]
MDTERVPRHRLIAFAAPAFITSLMYGPLVGILPTIYAKYFGLDLAVIGTVLVVSRLFDAVTDPVIGYLSDHTKTRIGRRKPWMLVGYGLTLFALYALFVPPEKVSATYFMVCSILFYLFMTMAEIPYEAWQAELSYDYRQRTRVVTYRAVSMNLGGMMFAALPFLPIFSTSEFTPEVFHVVAWGAIFLLPPAVLITVFLVPEGKQVAVRESGFVSELFSSAIRNKPFLNLMATFILFGVTGGVFSAAGFMYFDSYLLMGDKYPIIMLASSVTGVAAMPFWLKMMNRFGRHRTWAVGSFAGALAFPLILLFAPNSQAYLVLVLVWVLITSTFVSGMVAPMAMLGDVIDYDTLKTGASRTAQYYALLTLAMKVTGAVGSGFGFFILDFFHYDATATTHDATSVFGIKLAVVWIPVIFLFIAAVTIWFFPIDERRQRVIKRRIETRSERAQREETYLAETCR